MRAKLLKAFCILFGLLGMLLVGYLVIGGGWQDLIFGLRNREGLETFHQDSLPYGDDITEVRIYLLQGREDEATMKNFPGEHAIFAQTTVTGTELGAFMDLWHEQRASDWLSAGTCHNPAYGFRLYHGSKLVRELSMCWMCNSYHLQNRLLGTQAFGFNCHSPEAKKLLAFCDARLPYYRPPLKPLKTAMPSVKPKKPEVESAGSPE